MEGVMNKCRVTGFLFYTKMCYNILSPEVRRKLPKCIGNSQKIISLGTNSTHKKRT